MQVLAVTLNEFKQFLELLMWVAIPLVVVSIAVTLAIHYWRRKRNAMSEVYNSEYSDMLIMPREVGQDDDEAPTYNGMLWLRRKYHDDMATADQKTENLRTRFFELEKKYSGLLERGSLPSNSDHAEQQVIADHSPVADHEAAMDNLRIKLDEATSQVNPLKRELDDAKAEGSLLQERLEQPPEFIDTFNRIGVQVMDPETSVFERTSADLAEERARQISLLQQQLEDRIRMFHEVESQSIRISDQHQTMLTDIDGLRTEIGQLQSVNQSKTVYIDELEKDLSILQQQSGEHISRLNEQLETEMNKSYDLEQKLSFNQRLLQKIQHEISDSFEKQMILYTGRKKSDIQRELDITPKISAWIESPSEEEEDELEQIG